MNCKKCGEPLNDVDKFCEACGTKVQSEELSNGVSEILKDKFYCNCGLGNGKPDEDGYCEICGMKMVEKSEKQLEEKEEEISKELAMVSNIGKRHIANEDSGRVLISKKGAEILIVADGVSSSINAISASSKAVQIIGDILMEYDFGQDPEELLIKAIDSAHKAIIDLTSGEETKECDGPETTIVAAINDEDQIIIGWVGDSRAYLIDEDKEIQLTVDDSWVEEMVRDGQLTREAAMNDKRAHYITQVLGMKDDDIDIHTSKMQNKTEKMLLLCSDGLWNYFQREGELAKVISDYKNKEALKLCHFFVDKANICGGHDNITVAILMPKEK